MRAVVFFLLLCCGYFAIGQTGGKSAFLKTDSFSFNQLADSISVDTFIPSIERNNYSLSDSIRNDTLMRAMFNPYEQITQQMIKSHARQRLSLPTVKEIQLRKTRHAGWQFWVICFILFYISFVRISNQNNFRVFLLSVFNIKLSGKIWEEQRSVFNFVILQLFAIYLFIAALFINFYLEEHAVNPLQNYLTQYLVIVGFLLLIYAGKFLIHTLLGVILKMNRLGIGFVANTVSVNNFLSLIILPFIVIMIYNENKLFTTILTETIISIFFISVAYRMVRIAAVSQSFFSFPKIYLFIYLCALEIAPWLVIIKFINHYQI